MTSQKTIGRKSREKITVRLGASLEKSLSMYVAAAAASGVGLLALLPAAEAKIVYTRADETIPINGGAVPLDLNNDGTPDFSFQNLTYTLRQARHFFRLAVSPAASANRVWGRGTWVPHPGTQTMRFASALRRSFTVGPNATYFPKGKAWVMAAASSNSLELGGYSSTFGQWLYTQHRFLGLKFVINGRAHYGWARVDLTSSFTTAATLKGYAYETEANKPIVTGITKGPDVVEQNPGNFGEATLGELARGATGTLASGGKK